MNAVRDLSLLKKAREEKGVSLETVHEVTKIPLDVLRGFEEGYTVKNLSPFYYRGFLKIYAKYLNIETNQLLDEERKEEPLKHIDGRIEENELVEFLRSILKRVQGKHVIIVLGVILALFLTSRVIAFIKNKKAVKTSYPASTQKTKEKISKTPDVKQQAKKEEPKEKVKKEEAKKEISEAKDAQVKAAAAVVETVLEPGEASSTPTPEIKKDVVLTVRAKKSGWLKVRADDRVVFQAIINAGSVETWTADKEIEISGRNIAQLEFELNGKTIGLLGKEGREAKRVIVNKNGLSVTK